MRFMKCLLQGLLTPTRALQKYDVLSALMGSLVVTTIAVSRGQSLGMAAMLTVSSTVMALVRLTTSVWLYIAVCLYMPRKL